MKSLTSFLILLIAIVITLACSFITGQADSPEVIDPAATDESPAPSSFTLVILHPSQGDLSSQLAFHASQAAQLNRKPFVEFSADWCPPCQALAESLSDARMVEAFRGTYIIRLDLDEWKSQLGKSEFTVLGVPTFFELVGDGRPSGRMLTGAAWGEDIPENMAPPLKEFFQNSSDE